MKTEKNTLNTVLWAVSGLFMLVFFYFSLIQPLSADEWGWQNMRINSPADFFSLLRAHWYIGNGRMPGTALIILCMQADRWILALANTLVYCTLVWLICFHITGSFKIKPLWFLGVSAFFWFFTRNIYYQIFWYLANSTVYMWSSVIVLFFLVPFRKRLENDLKLPPPPTHTIKKYLIAPFFILGLIAGLLNENTGPGVIVLLTLYFVLKRRRNEKIEAFEIAGFIAFVIGFIILISSPGNQVRASSGTPLHENDYLPVKLFKRFLDVNISFFRGDAAVWIASLFTPIAVLLSGRRINMFACLMLPAALASVYSLVLSPYQPERCFFITQVFSIIALGSALSSLNIQIPQNRLSCLFAVTFALWLSCSFLIAGIDIVIYALRWRERAEYIVAQKTNGNLDIEVPYPIEVWDIHASPDIINENANAGRNKQIAEYFGVNSIKGVKSDAPRPSFRFLKPWNFKPAWRENADR